MSRTAQGELLIAKDGGLVLRYHDGRFAVLESESSRPRSPVLALAQTPSGLWMGTRDAGLFRHAGDETSLIRTGLPDAKINCLLPDGNQGMWIGTDDGIARWNGTALTSAGLPAKMNRFQALAMIRDRDGNLWIGTDSQGLVRLNQDGVASLVDLGDEPGGAAPHQAVTALFEDREGNLWSGSSSGLDRLRDSAFVSYSTPEGLPTDGSNPVFVDQENRMWFPPVAGGLWWVKNGHHAAIHQAGLDGDVIYSIAGRPGELWLGRQHGGLTELRWEPGSDAGLFQTSTYTQANGLAQNSVYSVYESRDGTVWAGTLSGGVSRLKTENSPPSPSRKVWRRIPWPPLWKPRTGSCGSPLPMD